MTRSHRIIATIAAALFASWMPFAFAQAPKAPAEIQQPASAYNDADLKSFAIAAIDVQRIRNSYLPKLNEAKTPEEEDRVRGEATERMVQAVEKQGMSVDKYANIAELAKQQSEVAAKIEQHVKDALGK